MFDPTAFDNMKVLLEGYLYDKDLDGLYAITDRNDFVNLAKMNRQFSIEYRIKKESNQNIRCKLTLLTSSQDIYDELLKSSNEVGCLLEMEFLFIENVENETLQRSLLLLKNNTTYNFTVKKNIKHYLIEDNSIESSFIISFKYKFTEEDFDQLEETIHISELMLQWYDEQLSKEK